MTSAQMALVTGGSRGIGRACVLALAQAGFRVAVGYVRGAEAAAETVRLVEAQGGTARAFQANVGVAAEVDALIKDVYAWGERLDVLVNNAGVTRDGLIMRMSEEDWDTVLDTNLKSAFLLSRAVARPMLKQRHGRIINITSVVGLMGNAGQVNYAASKAGLVGLTKSLAKELASRNVRVNAVAPGFIRSEMTEVLDAEVQRGYLGAIPLGRFGEPEEVAELVVYLATKAGYMTGQVLSVDGGLDM